MPKAAAAPRFAAQKVEVWAIEDLKPYDRNAREHPPEQVAALARSITEFGFTVPLLVAEDGEIIAGHGREMAARELGMAEVPVIVARGWTEEQRRAYRIADNALALGSEWNDDLLRVEIAALREDEFDLGLLALDPADLERLSLPVEAAEVEAPEEFKEFGEDVETDHQCPKCGYKWSGKPS